MALIESWSVKCEDCGKLYENAGESEGSARAITKSRGWTYSFAHGDRCQQCSRGQGLETGAGYMGPIDHEGGR